MPQDLMGAATFRHGDQGR